MVPALAALSRAGLMLRVGQPKRVLFTHTFEAQRVNPRGALSDQRGVESGCCDFLSLAVRGSGTGLLSFSVSLLLTHRSLCPSLCLRWELRPVSPQVKF